MNQNRQHQSYFEAVLRQHGFIGAAPDVTVPPPVVKQEHEYVPLGPSSSSPSATTTVKVKTETTEEPDVPKSSPLILIGKRRRGGRVLPTGTLKKVRTDTNDIRYKDQEYGDMDMKAHYLNQVKKYQLAFGEEDTKSTRPLVK